MNKYMTAKQLYTIQKTVNITTKNRHIQSILRKHNKKTKALHEYIEEIKE